MSTSSGRKSDKSRDSRRRNQGRDDEDRRERDRTPRRYDHDPSTFTTLDELEENVENFHLGARREEPSSSSPWSDWNWMEADPRGYWWRSKKDEQDEETYEYDMESQPPESDTPSPRHYTTAPTEDSTSRRDAWQSKSTSVGARSHREDESYNAESSGHVPRSGYSRPGPTQQGSYKSSQPSTKMSSGMMSQGDYIGRTVFTDDDELLEDSRDSTTEGNQQMSINISGSDMTASQSPQLPPVLIPPSSICGCDSKDHLCGVIIFPSHQSPKDGKISSKRSRGKTGSSSKSKSAPSSSSTSGPGSGSGSGRLSGPNGSGCGPIVMPGITPSPKPQPPSEEASTRDWNDYEREAAQWEEDYEDWKHITCPCRHGYFDVDGKWVSGGEVRRGKAVPNPRWDSTDGIAPDVTSTKEKYKLKLFERVYG
ncbi:hypothetical protein IFR05_000344 [Cadophora sp. M221]|nr:hypothetical protein IFR05_000344 [Cadophora sp. M221]